MIRRRIAAGVAALAVAAGVFSAPSATQAAPRPVAPPAPTVVQDKTDTARSAVTEVTGTPVKATRDGKGGVAPGGWRANNKLLFTAGYKYAAAQQGMAGTDFVKGLSANIYIAAPYVDATSIPADKDHSLTELAVQGGTGNGNIVEIGWASEPTAFGDNLPRLFASGWKLVGGVSTWLGCYGEGCGWVDLTPGNSADDLGRDLSSYASAAFPGMAKNFSVYNSTGAGFSCGADATGGWFFYFLATAVGCLPNSIWGGTFTQSVFVQGFGEVYSGGLYCSDMGNGKQGSSVIAPIDATDPAYIGSMTFAGPSPAGLAYAFNLTHTTSAVYSYGNVGSVGNRTFTEGGAGYTSTGTTPGNINSC